MSSHVRGRTLALAAATVVLVTLTALVFYAGTRPPPTLAVQPVLPVQPVQGVTAAPSAADQPSADGQQQKTSAGIPGVSSQWVAQTAAQSGIPEPAVRAYGVATLRSAQEQPSCHLAWTTLAGIGWVESHQGTIGGRTLEADGRPDRPIKGVTLDGAGKVANVPDGAGGYQRALGPLQFIPSTWVTWGSDGDGDGTADPQDIDDAAYTAARYLCADGYDLATAAGWSAAVLSYNHASSYVQAVYDAAKVYADRTS